VALPILAGSLRDKGHENLRLQDLNLDYVQWLMKDEVLAQAEAQLRRRQTEHDWYDPRQDKLVAVEEAVVAQAITHLPMLRRWLPETLDLFRLQRDVAYIKSIPREQAEREAAQVEVIFDILGDVYSALFYPWRIENLLTRREVFFTNDTWSRLDYNNVAWKNYFESLEHDRNPFLTFMREQVLPGLVARQPTVAGLSLMFREQFLAVWTLAALIRNDLPQTHVCIGGALFSDLEHYLYTAPEVRETVFSMADSIVLGPGELPFHSLLQRLAAGENHDDISNLLTLNNVVADEKSTCSQHTPTEVSRGSHTAGAPIETGRSRSDLALLSVRATSPDTVYAQSILPEPGASGEPGIFSVLPTRFEDKGKPPRAVKTLPSPIYFDGDLERYFYRTPQIIIPYLASYGCYWNKCTFCKYREQVHHYQVVSIDQILDDLKRYGDQYNTRLFHFNDETISPSFCQRFSARLLEEEMDIVWSGNARFDPGFTPELLGQMKASGCEYVSFGLESASERVLSLMDKGTEIEVIEQTMENFRTVGLSVSLYLFFGFPGETREDLQQTLDFLERHRSTICDMSVGRFSLYKGTGVFNHPERYGIRSIYYGDQVAPEVLMWNYDYELAPETDAHSRDDATRMYWTWHREAFGELGLWFSTDGSA
jgi:radical SAM superfamily enzyme YgiQ (UPF0313 family)